jgi:hypothetical protein
LDGIRANANDFDQQERIVKEVLRAQSSLLVYCLTKVPSTSMAAGVPSLAKLHAIKHATSKVVAAELLKETGLDEIAVAALAATLSPSILTGFLDGSRLNVANLLICYNAYKQVRVPGCRAYSLTEILSHLTFFRSFILVSVKLLAALGLNAENILLRQLKKLYQPLFFSGSSTLSSLPAFMNPWNILVPPLRPGSCLSLQFRLATLSLRHRRCMQPSRLLTKTASATFRNSDFLLPAFLQALAQLLLAKIRHRP